MAIRVALQHRTTYRYDRPVSLSPHVVRLRPAPHCRTTVVSYSLAVRPRDHFLNWQQDPQGNHLARLVFPKPVRELVLEVDLVADLVAINPFDFFLEPQAERFPFEYEAWQAAELAPFRANVPGGPLLDGFQADFSARHLAAERPHSIDLLVALNAAVNRRVRYVIRMEPGVQPPEETLAAGTGSCRDSAWLLVAVARRLGLAARFCSGYLVQLAPDTPPLEGPAGPAHDFTDLHAWTEVYLPGAGWVGLDPTSGLLAAEGHIPLAATPEPASAAPVTGGVGPCRTEFGFEMRVERLAESPRTTRPFSAETWARIDAVGNAVDAVLAADDVRLTAGGEPTYVSIDDFDSPQWNTAALGAEKRRQAELLARRLLAGLARGGVLLETQGKWYPGEVLPRWALELVWRKDGGSLWKAPTESPAESATGPIPADRAAECSAAFIHRLAAGLALDGQRVLPAHEHPFGDPAIAPTEADLHRVGPVVAHVLPLLRHRPPAAAGAGSGRWRSSGWPLPLGRVFLAPGDSPAGLRLPLATLPWPDERALREGTSIVRTALVTQVRDGRLHVFLPPLEPAEGGPAPTAVTAADDWLDLVALIGEVAAAEGVTPVLEGYPPPADDRLARMQVTPDPGVIEVNVPPTRTWAELVAVREELDREARAVRLGAEKFEVDGLHVGTGGGDHLVLGGPTAAESPFLRRPELLAGMVAYWNNHPSLSYLFSGRFIGPTSQAPRVDEARHESLYELEIAIEQLAAAGPRPPPWLVDRLFRHLLVDLTGNTHRAEFCIDKLFSPDTASGRRGLVELRGFEMAPHVRMGLLAQLVVRALVARLARVPCRTGLVRWGTALHDRFMLPTFVMRDFRDVLADLRDAGFAFEDAWFDVYREFRFPKLGELAHEGLRLELRAALEPWHVLGEQPVGPATSRLVDASLNRIEVLVSGLVHPRYAVACNGRRVPLTPTGPPGEYVAGVRFRAWRPPECLHPTIPVHAPLVFDLLDLWSRRSVAGCTWHVAHPGGRSYETRPVNALEAESRRVSRFFASGHTPGPLEPPPEETNPAYPVTLDLRRRG